MLNTAVPGLIFIAVVLSFVPHDLMYGPQAALIAECFTAAAALQRRSIGYQLCVDHRRRAGATDRHRDCSRPPDRAT